MHCKVGDSLCGKYKHTDGGKLTTESRVLLESNKAEIRKAVPVPVNVPAPVVNSPVTVVNSPAPKLSEDTQSPLLGSKLGDIQQEADVDKFTHQNIEKDIWDIVIVPLLYADSAPRDKGMWTKLFAF